MKKLFLEIGGWEGGLKTWQTAQTRFDDSFLRLDPKPSHVLPCKLLKGVKFLKTLVTFDLHIVGSLVLVLKAAKCVCFYLL